MLKEKKLKLKLLRIHNVILKKEKVCICVKF